MFANFSFFIEISFALLLLYVEVIGNALNTRSIASPHFSVPGMSFFAIMFFYDEMRKIYIRQGIVQDEITKRLKMKGWVARNTLY